MGSLLTGQQFLIFARKLKGIRNSDLLPIPDYIQKQDWLLFSYREIQIWDVLRPRDLRSFLSPALFLVLLLAINGFQKLLLVDRLWLQKLLPQSFSGYTETFFPLSLNVQSVSASSHCFLQILTYPGKCIISSKFPVGYCCITLRLIEAFQYQGPLTNSLKATL